MRRVIIALAVLAWVATPVLGAVGEQWILPISHRQNEGWGGWTLFPGVGYNGTDAWQGSGPNWARIYWELSGTGDMGNTPDPAVQLYTIEVFGPTAGGTGWQPIESQINGAGGEQWPMDPNIPWAGQWGTNHQWIGSDGSNDGGWHSTGPGPQAPASDDYNAPGNGIYMWLKEGSWLYAKWDFPWPITRCWSALRLTQITGPIVATLDILPQDDPNLFTPNKKSKGRLPMAILGSEDLDVAEIDVDSISIAGVVFPVKQPSADKDENGDGMNDLVIHVSRRDLIDALNLDLEPDGAVVDITVNGALLDSTPIEATDSIVIQALED